MKILVLNWRDPQHPLAGGAEISLFQHIKYWQKKGAKVTWYASSFKGAKSEECFNGINIIRKGNHYTVALNFVVDWVKGRFKENDIIVDCFHFIPFFTPLFVKDKKIIVLIHEVAREVWFKNLFFPLNLVGYFLEPFIIRFYDDSLFITVSNSTKKELIGVGVSSKKIHVIENGVTILKSKSRYNKEKKPTLMFLGRLSKDKGIEDAIRAFNILLKENNKIKLWVIGKYENNFDKSKIENIVNNLRLNNHIKFFGYVDEVLKEELLQRAWLLIHPSLKEGWGLNVIEANSFGVPAVGYNVPGLRDSIINNKTGLLVDSDFLSLSEGLKKILSDPNKIKLLSNNAYNWSKNFTWDKSGEKSWKLLNSYD